MFEEVAIRYIAEPYVTRFGLCSAESRAGTVCRVAPDRGAEAGPHRDRTIFCLAGEHHEARFW